MYPVAGAFIAFYAVMVYSELYEPRRIGFRHELRDRSMILTQVTPGSPAGRAGLKAGDRVLAVDGSPIHEWEDWNRVAATREIGRHYRFEIERAGQQSEFEINLARKPGDPLGRLEKKRYVQFFLLMLALTLAFSGHGERSTQSVEPSIGVLLHDCIGLLRRNIGVLQCRLARVGKLHLGEGDMIEPQLRGIDDRAKPHDDAAFDEPFHPLLARRLGQADLLGEFGEGDPPILAQHGEDLPVEFIQIDWR